LNFLRLPYQLTGNFCQISQIGISSLSGRVDLLANLRNRCAFGLSTPMINHYHWLSPIRPWICLVSQAVTCRYLLLMLHRK